LQRPGKSSFGVSWVQKKKPWNKESRKKCWGKGLGRPDTHEQLLSEENQGFADEACDVAADWKKFRVDVGKRGVREGMKRSAESGDWFSEGRFFQEGML